MDTRDFVCVVCYSHYFWIKKWNPDEPGWYALCSECKELYELLADGTVSRLQYLETN